MQRFPELTRETIGTDWSIAPHVDEVLSGRRSLASFNSQLYKVLKLAAEVFDNTPTTTYEKMHATYQVKRMQRIGQAVFISRIGDLWLNKVNSRTVCDMPVPFKKLKDINEIGALDYAHAPLAAQIAWSFELAAEAVMPGLFRSSSHIRDTAWLTKLADVFDTNLRETATADRPLDPASIRRFPRGNEAKALGPYTAIRLAGIFEIGLTASFGGLGVVHTLTQESDDPAIEEQVPALAESSGIFDARIAATESGRGLSALMAMSHSKDFGDMERDVDAFEIASSGSRVRLRDDDPIAQAVKSIMEPTDDTPKHGPVCAALFAKYSPDLDNPDLKLPVFGATTELVRDAYQHARLFDPAVRRRSALDYAAHLEVGVDRIRGALYTPVWNSGGPDVTQHLALV